MKLILQWWAACLYYMNCICINAIGWLVLHYRVGILIKTNRFCHMLFTCFSIIIIRWSCQVILSIAWRICLIYQKSSNINLIEKYSKYNSVAKRFDLNPIISTGGKHLETLIRLKIQRVKIWWGGWWDILFLRCCHATTELFSFIYFGWHTNIP